MPFYSQEWAMFYQAFDKLIVLKMVLFLAELHRQRYVKKLFQDLVSGSDGVKFVSG